MKIDLAKCTEVELWKYVGSHLAQNGIDAVLVGGAVVSIYTKGAYQSGDLGFIVQNIMTKDLEPIMAKIGFIKKSRHYVNPKCKHLFVEFPPGPLGIGNDTAIKPLSNSETGAIIKILSPTDCIKDRLASYIHFKSIEGLDQAVLVAESQLFKKTEVERWCKHEGFLGAYDEFIGALRNQKK